MTENDEVLLKRYADERDAEAFAAMAQRHAGLVYSAARRIVGNSHDAEDVAQECFLTLARNAGSVRASLPGWLHSLAVSRAKDLVRGNRRRILRESAPSDIPAVNAETASWGEIAPHIDDAISDLPEDLRQAVVEHYLDGATQADLAARWGVNQSTVSRRIERAVEALRASLAHKGVLVLAGTLAGLLAAESGQAAPASLAASLGKMAAAGIGGASKPAVVPAGVKAAIVAAIVAIMVTLALFFVPPRPSPVPPVAAAPTVPSTAPTVPTTLPAPPPKDVVAERPLFRLHLIGPDGRDAAGAEVIGRILVAVTGSTTYFPLSGRTDAHGVVAVPDPYHGALPLRVVAQAIARGVGGASDGPWHVDGRRNQEFTVRLSPLCAIAGEVRRRDTGAPVTGLPLSFIAEDVDPCGFSMRAASVGSATTDENGRFSFPDVWPGRGFFSLNQEHGFSGSLRVVTRLEEKPLRVTFTVDPLPAYAFPVLVLRADGQTPARDTLIEAQGEKGEWRTGPDGRVTVAFRRMTDRKGDVILAFRHEDYAPRMETFPLPAGGSAAEVSVVLKDKGGSLTGSAWDSEAGQPLADVVVAAVPVSRAGDRFGERAVAEERLRGFEHAKWYNTLHHTARTDARGRYRMDRLAAGDYVVLLLPERGANVRKASITVREKGVTEGVDFTVVRHPPGVLTGRLFDKDGRPMANWYMGISWTGDARGYARLVADADGRYSWRPPQPGAYEIRVRGSFTSSAPVRVSLAADVVPAETDLTLLPDGGAVSGSVSGRAVLADGKSPARGAYVVPYAVDASFATPEGWAKTGYSGPSGGHSVAWDPGNAIRADGEGRFWIMGLTPGRYQLAAAMDMARFDLRAQHVRLFRDLSDSAHGVCDIRGNEETRDIVVPLLPDALPPAVFPERPVIPPAGGKP